MAINIHQAKKRDRADMTRMMMAAPAASGTTTPSSSFDQQEYDRAVAFLRELRSRPVDPASAAVASRLETVVEDDGGLEEMMLAADFTLALSGVGRSQPSTSGKPSVSMKRRHHRSRSSGNNSRRGVLLGLGASRMKKTATVKCLLDLDDDSGISSGDEKSTSSSSMAFVQPRKCDIISNDYCLGYDVITSSPPTSKRQRSRLGRFSSV